MIMPLGMELLSAFEKGQVKAFWDYGREYKDIVRRTSKTFYPYNSKFKKEMAELWAKKCK